MNFKFHPPLAMHELGQRKRNEDCIYPAIEDIVDFESNRLFLVCDGVGGEAKGEEASRLACSSFSKFLKDKTAIDKTDIATALRLTEQSMDDYIALHPEAAGMATTLTLLFFDDQKATVAHIGDSRVYQIRLGKIIFKTVDHSLVQELITNNVITQEQAVNHPNRNVVTKAIIGTQKPTQAEISYINDIEEGDYFFMCTDGVLESVSDEDLEKLFGQDSITVEEKMEQIRSKCCGKSRDNFSSYLIHIKNIENAALKKGISLSLEESVLMSSVNIPIKDSPSTTSQNIDEKEENVDDTTQQIIESQPRFRIPQMTLSFLAFIAFLMVTWVFWNRWDDITKNKKPTQEENYGNDTIPDNDLDREVQNDDAILPPTPDSVIPSTETLKPVDDKPVKDTSTTKNANQKNGDKEKNVGDSTNQIKEKNPKND